MKTTKQLKQEERERIEQLTKEENKTIYSAISEADEQINTLKKAASTQNLDKTAKFYDSAIKNINKAKTSIEKTEKAKAKEEENKNKPKKEKKQPYMERFIQIVEIDGKKKDKYEIQKTQTSPIITKYKVHKPIGLNKEQMEEIKQTMKDLKEKVESLGDDYTFQQFKVYVNSCLKYEPQQKPEIEEMAVNW
ncbi:MAG: hypothetical protein MJ211_15885 [Bacteroidales bacterium]|nr:hypothetical protein [Bacteroidales bacterium]